MKLTLEYFGHVMQKIYSLERPWCWERLKSWEEGADSKWDGWIVSLIEWTWFWAMCWNRSWTGWPGMLQFLGSQRVGLNWPAENELRHPGKLEFHISVICYSPVLCKKSETNDERTSKSRHILVEFFFFPTDFSVTRDVLSDSSAIACFSRMSQLSFQKQENSHVCPCAFRSQCYFMLFSGWLPCLSW